MKRVTLIQWIVVCLATMGLCFPQVAMAANGQAKPPTTVIDVRLSEDGALHGYVVTPENAPVADTVVSLCSAKLFVGGTTDPNGFFTFAKLPDGVYQLSVAQSTQTCRVWSAATAPPAARPHAQIVVDTVRGQYSMRNIRDCLANPIIIGAIIATAVAIPVAIHNSKGPSSP